MFNPQTTIIIIHLFLNPFLSFGFLTCIQASEKCGINYSTAKSIVKLLKIEGRVNKKKNRISRKCENKISKNERSRRFSYISCSSEEAQEVNPMAEEPSKQTKKVDFET